jgi:ribosome-associated protein
MEPEERPSKTQRKKAMHELQSLGERLVALNPAQLAAVELPEELRDAVREAAHVKSHEGRRRHMQYIGRLMREVDPEPIRQALAAWNQRSRQEAAREHEIDRWRERLLADETALAEFASLHPEAEVQRLKSLIHNARDERDAGRPPKSYRELYRALRACMPASAPQTEKQ